MSVPPHLSDDLYRYMWDGRVQAAGIDPYAYVPSAPQLAHLRDPFLWTAARASSPYRHCVWPGASLPGHPAANLVTGCTRINRPTVPTIYPPIAEAYFLVLHYVTPVHAGSAPVQAAAGACAVLVTLVLLAGLRWLGRDLRWAALWAWCPTVALEAGNSAHVDVIAVLLTTVALLVLARRSGGTRGALLGRRAARAGHRDQDDTRPSRARGAAAQVVGGHHQRGRCRCRRLRAARTSGRQQGHRIPAGLPAGGGIRQRPALRYHRAVRERAPGHRDRRRNPRGERPGRAALLRPRPALARRARHDRRRPRRDHAELPVVRDSPGHASGPGWAAGMAGVRGRQLPRRRAPPGPVADHPPPAGGRVRAGRSVRGAHLGGPAGHRPLPAHDLRGREHRGGPGPECPARRGC